jgi:hypothetical protein
VKLDRLILFFSTDPSAKLLRSPNAAHVIYFLNRQFKHETNLTLPQSVLQENLRSYLDDLHETEPDKLSDRPEVYLTKWSTGDSRWLRRSFDSQFAEPVYQLTPHTEDVLKFVTGVLDRSLGFVGTESRLTRIIETLSDIVVRGSSDPERRLAFLEAEKQLIDSEIESIKSGKAVKTHSPTAIRERFSDAVSDLVSLQSDFRAVEESFKTITRDVQKRQNENAGGRGDILGFALESEDELNEGDQGTSFNAFVKLLLSQSQQDDLERMINQLDQIEDLDAQSDGKRRLHGMIGSLSAEAEKVMRTTRRLSHTLRRLLDNGSSSARMHLANVLRQIQAEAVRLADDPPDFGLELLTEPNVANFLDRPMWSAPVQFEAVELVSEEPDEDERLLAFRQLAQLQRLDWQTMRDNIQTMQRDYDTFSLRQLFEAHPPTAGSIEVVAYVQLAHDAGHHVDQDATEEIIYPDATVTSGFTTLEVPKVIFAKPGIEPMELQNA